MKRFLRKFWKQSRHGEKGFTLIELLVVVAILGVLTAIIVPSVGKFIGTGTIEAANEETHNVQLAVLAYTADNSTTVNFSGDVGPATSNGPEAYLTDPARLQATYHYTDGALTGADFTPGGKWDSLTYTPASGWHY